MDTCCAPDCHEVMKGLPGNAPCLPGVGPGGNHDIGRLLLVAPVCLHRVLGGAVRPGKSLCDAGLVGIDINIPLRNLRHGPGALGEAFGAIGGWWCL